jgi:hypothetical protein
VLCLLLSVGSAAACLLLGAQAAALQGRVAALEEERELLRRAGPPAAWAEPHLERLLREVRRRRGGAGAARKNRVCPGRRLSLRGGVAPSCAHAPASRRTVRAGAWGCWPPASASGSCVGACGRGETSQQDVWGRAGGG